jgi:hypothetical protein
MRNTYDTKDIIMKNTTQSNRRVTVKKNLGSTGLSMSDAQSASNMANQIATSIERDLKKINNYSKHITVSGNEKTLLKGVIMPENVVELVKKKAQCHALQAFLMESISLKEELMKEEKNRVFITDLVEPARPQLKSYVNLPLVDETFGWNQLSDSEYNEFLENEAIASHYGQFIHNGSILDNLRKEIDTVPSIEWFELEKDKKTPVDIDVHHDKTKLDSLHTEFSHLHREAEKKVNYFKAKVKNLVSNENSRIEKLNAEGMEAVRVENKKLTDQYNIEQVDYSSKYQVEFKEFQSKKETTVNELSALKIVVDPRFKVLLDEIIGDKK